MSRRVSFRHLDVLTRSFILRLNVNTVSIAVVTAVWRYMLSLKCVSRLNYPIESDKNEPNKGNQSKFKNAGNQVA